MAKWLLLFQPRVNCLHETFSKGIDFGTAKRPPPPPLPRAPTLPPLLLLLSSVHLKSSVVIRCNGEGGWGRGRRGVGRRMWVCAASTGGPSQVVKLLFLNNAGKRDDDD